MELNREQIIKALECLWYEKECVGDECPLFELGGDCAPLIAMEALSLIKELTEENKTLSEKIVQLISQVDCDKAEINLLRKHIESLGTTIEMQEQEVHSIKADTVRKMQERLIAEFRKDDRMNYYLRKTLDQIAKEMLEGENGH